MLINLPYRYAYIFFLFFDTVVASFSSSSSSLSFYRSRFIIIKRTEVRLCIDILIENKLACVVRLGVRDREEEQNEDEEEEEEKRLLAYIHRYYCFFASVRLYARSRRRNTQSK